MLWSVEVVQNGHARHFSRRRRVNSDETAHRSKQCSRYKKFNLVGQNVQEVCVPYDFKFTSVYVLLFKVIMYNHGNVEDSVV